MYKKIVLSLFSIFLFIFTAQAGWPLFRARAANGFEFLIKGSLAFDVGKELWCRSNYLEIAEENGKREFFATYSKSKEENKFDVNMPSRSLQDFVSALAKKHDLQKPIKIVSSDRSVASMVTGEDTCYLHLPKDDIIKLNLIGNSYKNFDYTKIDNNATATFLKENTFIIGHEIMHAIKAQEAGLSLAKGDEHSLNCVYACAKFGAYSILRARGFSVFKSWLSFLPISLVNTIHTTRIAVREEFECDARASLFDPKVLRAGARWFEKHSEAELDRLSSQKNSHGRTEPLMQYLNKYPLFFETRTLHPLNKHRTDALYKRADEIEKNQREFQELRLFKKV